MARHAWISCLGLWLACSTPRHGEGASSSAAAPTPPASQAPASRPAPPPEPPSLSLVVLRERLDVGLAIQNRSAAPQRFAASARLEPAGGAGPARELVLREGDGCITLRPGAEWLWPADWGLTLAPDQAALAGLAGDHRFAIVGCEGGAPVRSDTFTLPVHYFGSASGPGK